MVFKEHFPIDFTVLQKLIDSLSFLQATSVPRKREEKQPTIILHRRSTEEIMNRLPAIIYMYNIH